MGWVTLLVLAAIGAAAVAALRVPRLLWSAIGAAAMLGAAGYAWQGRPMLAARPATASAAIRPDDLAMIDLRNRMLGQYTADGAYLVAADAMSRTGDPRAAVRVILGGINHVPESLMLWTALGSALATHDGDRVSPPALFAFQQAMRLSPRHPAPPFFLGLAYIREENFDAAQQYWRRALALTPPNASYRPDIAVRLMLLDRMIAMRDRTGR
ncbi:MULTISPECIES: tetratricopeptide repeat protein [unclassified Sphingomonas]|jgi:tetratricopeptide (TPR) repeat protein|uniref:tetratricopeptide repeat protein n=1 Tax=unclassified Sphingomonas TaxID=196159 RepID=UPI000E102262|nr:MULTISPECIES: tetratricopeptide repeat protein [unclassified Sphingomonas]AXJ94292.1 hypothetical protein DM480_01070 [Sphingomonas sp. FARSPH]